MEPPSAPSINLKPWLIGSALVLLLLAGLLGFAYWYYVARDIPTQFADPAEHFKYGRRARAGGAGPDACARGRVVVEPRAASRAGEGDRRCGCRARDNRRSAHHKHDRRAA